MVDDRAHVGTARSQLALSPLVAEVAFVAFLLLVFVGLSPFAIRDPATLAAGATAANGAGDLLRQACFATVFALIVATALQQNGLRAFMAVSPLLALLLLWCLASASWSPEAGVTLRRAALATVVVLSTMLSVATVGTDRALRLLRYVLGAVLIVNWLSIPFIPQAVHLPGEIDPGLVGNWRGLYFHKNIAGAVSAITALVFFFSALRTRRILDIALFTAAVGFTVMTHSKSSIALLPVAILCGVVYRAAWRRGIDRMIVAVGLALLCTAAVTIALADSSWIAHKLEDPTAFTGRAAIWQGEVAFIRDHPLLGSGFGSFADTGKLSPLHNYVGDAWVQNIAHGHNAYLELFVTIGGIGFVLALLSLLVEPGLAFWRRQEFQPEFMPLLFAIFVFVVLHNFLESDFLEGNSQAWVTFLAMLAMLRIPVASATPAPAGQRA